MRLRRGRFGVNSTARIVEVLEFRRVLSAGSLDGTFGGNGTVAIPGAFSAMSIIQQSDDRLVVVGGQSVVRLNIDGSRDLDFGTNGVVSSTASLRSVALYPDGRIVAAGSNGYSFVVERFLPDGSYDLTFNGTGIATARPGNGSNPAWSVKVQPDGKIAVAGFDFDAGGDFLAARFLENGQLDHSFGNQGTVRIDAGSSTDFASDILVRPDGRLILVGGGGSYPSNGDFVIVQLNANGSRDTSFGINGIVHTDFTTESARSAALLPDGRLIVAGPGGNLNAIHLAKYNTDGSLDLSFGTSGKVITNVSYISDNPHMALQPDGGIIVAGDHVGTMLLLRYRPDGTLDPNFSSEAASNVSGGAQTVLVQRDGRIVAAGGYGTMVVARFESGIIPETQETLVVSAWKDLNRDGIRQLDEPGINGRAMEARGSDGSVFTGITQDLDLNHDGMIDPATETGVVRFVVMAGKLEIRQQIGDGWYPAVSSATLSDILAARAHQKYHFRLTGNEFLNSLGGAEKWIYSNRGWCYILPDGQLFRWTQPGTRILTGELIARLDPRYYKNLTLLPAAIDPSAVHLEVTNGGSASVAFPLVPSGRISGQVWHDANADGTRGSTEPFRNNVGVELRDAQGTLIATTSATTVDFDRNGVIDPDREEGWYIFDDVPVGDYRITIGLQDDWRASYAERPLDSVAHDLNQSLHFRLPDRDFQDWGGMNEKWLSSDSGWHYITPDGQLWKWKPESGRKLQGSLVAGLSIEFWSTPSLLTIQTFPSERLIHVGDSQVAGVLFGTTLGGSGGAGNVRITLRGGTLNFLGDNLSNHVVVYSGTNGQEYVVGIGMTHIQGSSAPVLLADITQGRSVRNVLVQMFGGDDHFVIHGISGRSALPNFQFSGGTGGDTLVVQQSLITGRFLVSDFDNGNRVILSKTQIGGNTTISFGSGTDEVILRSGTGFGESVLIAGGGGRNLLRIASDLDLRDLSILQFQLQIL